MRKYARLLRIEPQLGIGLTEEQLSEARRLAVVPVVSLPRGQRTADELLHSVTPGGTFGFMVVNGVIAHDLALGGRVATHLLGRGDILAPRVRSDGSLPVSRLFSVSDATRLAMLDATLHEIIRRWPPIAGALLMHAEHQMERVAIQQLISQLPRAEQRIVALLWHLADRWGRAEPPGVVVTLTLSHEAIAHLVGGRRPTVSAALVRLADRQLVARRPNGTWLLADESRALLNTAPPPRPTLGIEVLGGRAPAPV